jgi:hypothetical protein
LQGALLTKNRETKKIKEKLWRKYEKRTLMVSIGVIDHV